jgi:hypothetical protein
MLNSQPVYNPKVAKFHSGVAEETSLVDPYTVSTGKHLPKVQSRSAFIFGMNSWKKVLLGFPVLLNSEDPVTKHIPVNTA